jgi:hypothetical protein
MAITAKTNKLTDLVALRFLINAGFLTVGAKEHFKDQMVGKRNGQTYTFVIRDAGEAIEGGEGAGAVDITSATKTITEREIQMSLRDFVVPIETSAIEAVTDVNWDKEVAEPNGAKLANKVIRTAVGEAVTQANVAIYGEGFQPLAEVAAHLGSISNEKMYGFIDPKIEAILTANGQQFNPVGSPDSFYSKGLLGTFHSVEYRGQRFMPTVKVPAITLGATANSDTWLAADADNQNKLSMSITLTAPGSDVVIKKGTPIFIEGAMAADLIGDATTEKFAFIVSEDVAVAADATTAKLPIVGIAKTADEFTSLLTGNGARAIVKEDNTSFANIAALKNLAISTLPAGDYFMGQVRLDGTYEFCTLDKLDASNAESKLGAVEGVKVHENRVVNLNTLNSTTRWDIVAMFGGIEKRGIANVYVKV